MKKPIFCNVLFFIITSISSFGQGVWIEERPGLEEGLREGKIKINGNIYDIEPRAILSGANLEGADLSHADLSFAVLDNANLAGANLSGVECYQAIIGEANLTSSNLEGGGLKSYSLPSYVLEKGLYIVSLKINNNILTDRLVIN